MTSTIAAWLPWDEDVGVVVAVHVLIYVGGALAVLLQHMQGDEREKHRLPSLGAALFAACALPGPYGLPKTERVQRALTCFTSGFYFCRMLQLSSPAATLRTPHTQPRSIFIKLSHTFLTFMDTTGTYGGPPPSRRERLRAVAQLSAAVLNAGIVALAGTMAAARLQAGSSDLEISSAVLMGGVCVLSGLTAFGDALCGVWMLAAGLRLPVLMRNPAMSLSLREFWGQRWNSVVQRALKDGVFLRVSRCGKGGSTKAWKRTAAAVTFMCSGLIHAYPVFVAHDCVIGRPVVWVLSYFLVQGLATFLQRACVCSGRRESSLGTRLMRRFITLCVVILPSPILVAVMMTLPLAPGSERLRHVEERLQSVAFARTWVVLAACSACWAAVGAEVLLWSGVSANFFHYREQREYYLSSLKPEQHEK